MSKQTFTTGQVLTAAQMTSLQQTALLGGEASAKVASYTLVAADAGTAISMSNASATTITVNTGLFAAGDIVTILNLGAGVSTITAGTATVATSGSLALAQNQGGVLRFTSASASIFFQFATPASGDIEGVTAGTGISGGGTSGTVTITNSMATAIDAKGDLVVGTGADAFSRLAAGTNGFILSANSGEATGLEWIANDTGDITGITTGTDSGLSGGATSGTVTLRQKLEFDAETGTTYTLLAANLNQLVTLNNASAITLTVPPSVFSAGDVINIAQIGAGQVTLAQGAGVTITSTGATSSAPKLRAQQSAASIICTASNTFLVVGDLA